MSTGMSEKLWWCWVGAGGDWGGGCCVFVHELRAIVIISRAGLRLECSQAVDRISTLNSRVEPTSEFALIRTRGTLLVAELKWITSCHRERRAATDTNKQLRPSERVRTVTNTDITL